MAVTTTNMGTYTGLISYPAGTTIGELQTAVENFLLAHGWTLWDASAGVNTKAYRALNRDGGSYKYITMSFTAGTGTIGLPIGRLNCVVYESWNATSHSGTNPCYSSNETWNSIAFDLIVGGEILINASIRWAFLISRLTGTFSALTQEEIGLSGIPIGVVEIARDNPLDTIAAGYPCWAAFCGLYSTAPYTSLYSPRLKDGSTGSNATLQFNSILGNGFGGISQWTHKFQPQTLLVSASAGNETKGRAYGIKGFRIGSLQILDEVDIKVDSDFFMKATGTTVTHIVISAPSKDQPRYLLPK